MIGVRYGGRRATRSARMRAMTPVETSTTPETVHAATRAFGTDLRVELLRWFFANPGPQAAAVTALQQSSANVSRNVQSLMDAGAIVVTAGKGGARHYAVDPTRVGNLAGSTVAYILGS